jgi:hypothetical protein
MYVSQLGDEMWTGRGLEGEFELNSALACFIVCLARGWYLRSAACATPQKEPPGAQVRWPGTHHNYAKELHVDGLAGTADPAPALAQCPDTS